MRQNIKGLEISKIHMNSKRCEIHSNITIKNANDILSYISSLKNGKEIKTKIRILFKLENNRYLTMTINSSGYLKQKCKDCDSLNNLNIYNNIDYINFIFNNNKFPIFSNIAKIEDYSVVKIKSYNEKYI